MGTFSRPTAKTWQSWDLTPGPMLLTTLTCYPSGGVQLWGPTPAPWKGNTGPDLVPSVEQVAPPVGAQSPVTCSLSTKTLTSVHSIAESHPQSWSGEPRGILHTKNCNTALSLVAVALCLLLLLLPDEYRFPRLREHWGTLAKKTCILRALLPLDLSKISDYFCYGQVSKSSFNWVFKLIIHSFAQPTISTCLKSFPEPNLCSKIFFSSLSQPSPQALLRRLDGRLQQTCSSVLSYTSFKLCLFLSIMKTTSGKKDY